MREVLAFTQGVTHPSSRLRIAAYGDFFRTQGWELSVHAFDPGMGKAPVRNRNFVQSLARRVRRRWNSSRAAARLRSLLPETPIIISRELPVNRKAFWAAPNPLILDVDDALYLGAGRDHFIELCRRAKVVVCGNQTIAGHLAEYANRCVVIPTVIHPAGYEVKPVGPLGGPLRLGWLGSSMSFAETLGPFLPMLAEINKHQPFEMILISDGFPEPAQQHDWIRFLSWSPVVEHHLASHIDAGIMPLQDTEYQRAKCGSKLLHYMAAGLPAIASPVGVNRELVIPGATGYWAANAAEWAHAIGLLASSDGRRESLGRQGRRHVIQHYSLEQHGQTWMNLLKEITGGCPRQ